MEKEMRWASHVLIQFYLHYLLCGMNNLLQISLKQAHNRNESLELSILIV